MSRTMSWADRLAVVGSATTVLIEIRLVTRHRYTVGIQGDSLNLPSQKIKSTLIIQQQIAYDARSSGWMATMKSFALAGKCIIFHSYFVYL